MINIETEALITLKEAIPLFPGFKKLSMPTVYRWFQQGVNGVKLETVVIGVNRFTSAEAIKRFIKSQNEPSQAVVEQNLTKRQRRNQAAAAQEALQEALK